MKEQEIKKDHILPGQMVYADHYISQAPGRLNSKNGKSDPSDISQEVLSLLTMPVVM